MAFGGYGDDMPEVSVAKGVNNIIDIMCAVGVCKSKSEARNLITGGGVKVDEEKVEGFDYSVSDEMLENGFILHKGKKVHVRVKAQ